MARLALALHAAASLLAALAAILALVLLRPKPTPYRLVFTVDDRERRVVEYWNHSHFIPRVTNVTDASVRMDVLDSSRFNLLLLLVALPTALHHAVRCYQGAAGLDAVIKARFSGLRWAEYAITSTSMTTNIAVLSGVADVCTLGLLAVSSVVMIGLGGFHEACQSYRQPTTPGTTYVMLDSASRGFLLQWGPYLLATVLFLAQWTVILGTFHAATAGVDDVPAWVSGVVSLNVVFMSAFPLVAFWDTWRAPRYARVELAYTVLSLVIKQLFFYFLIFGYASYERVEAD